MSLEINISSKNIELAKKRYAKIKKARSTIYKGCRLHGFIAEEVFLQNFGGKLVDNINYDIELGELGSVDIKAKRTKRPPKPTYTCTVYKYQVKKPVDYYVFCSVLEDFSKIWILGAESKDDFVEKAKLYKKGEVQENANPPFRFWEDSYVLEIGKLRDVREIMYESH